MLKKKANISDLNDFKKLLEQINLHITTISSNLNKLTKEEKELEEEVRKLKLRLENININTNIGGDNTNIRFDQHKYLEKSVFIDFKSDYNKEIENIYRRLDELKKWIDEILELLKKFATKDELKQLEGKYLFFLMKY